MDLQTELAKTTILIEKSTRERLSSVGKHGETYDNIINRIMDEWEAQQKVKV
jgi:hypothetical protein